VTTHYWSFNAQERRGAISDQVVLREIAIAELAGEALRPVLLDLLEVAAAVQAADRMTRRPSANVCGSSWSRRLHLVVGVRDLAVWSDEIRLEFERLLSWLTDDDWNLEFTKRSGGHRRSESVNLLFGADLEIDCVALFSGGLDSVMGLATDLSDGRTPIAVSAISNLRMGASQKDTLQLLEVGLERTVPRVEVRFNLRRERSIENTQRSRGLGFLAMAAAVADALDLEVIRVYENGVGAINLPYLASQVGAHGTRSMHPVTLRRAANLFSRILDRPIAIENPHLLRTKAEMCALAPTGARPSMMASRSCDSAFTSRRPRQPWNCGMCTSCLLRRQALLAGGLEEVDRRTDYATDFLVAHPAARTAPADRTVEVMLAQAARLQAATAATEPIEALMRAFPDVALVASPGSDGRLAPPHKLVRMYRQYAEEWASIPIDLVGKFLAPVHVESDLSRVASA
jgi:7-cyano-7-deazaguanine synthase in queuosine biosynthesis